MTNTLLIAFTQLRNCERASILRELGYNFHVHNGENNCDFCSRVVRQIAHDGKVRELEFEMRKYQ